MNTIEDKNVVVTGASSGAGLAIALELAQRKARLILAARNASALEDAVTECRQLGADAHAYVVDVSEEKAMINLAAFAESTLGSIDIWINNAGVLAAGAFADTPLEVHDQVIKTNLMGYMHGAHAALPYFKKQGYGHIINNISIGAFMPVPYGAAYSASKFGLRGFSEALRAELSAEKNIYVSDLFPAFLDTPGMRHAANYTGKEIKPAPPLTDPRIVARAVCRVIERPTSIAYPDLLSPVLRIIHGLSPKITGYATALFLRNYLQQAEPMSRTSGNIFNPLKFGNSVDGGHKAANAAVSKKIIAGSMLAGTAIAFLLMRKS